MYMENQGLWLTNENRICLQQVMCLQLAKKWFRRCVLCEAFHQGTKGSMPAGRGQVTVSTADSRLGSTDWQQMG